MWGQHLYVWLILSGVIGSYGKPPWYSTICIRTSILWRWRWVRLRGQWPGGKFLFWTSRNHRLVWMWSQCVLSERECICCHEFDILKEKLEVEDVDCVTQNMDLDSAYLNPSVLSTSNVTCMRFKGIGGGAEAILINIFFFSTIDTALKSSTSFVKSFLSAAKVYVRAVPFEKWKRGGTNLTFQHWH